MYEKKVRFSNVDHIFKYEVEINEHTDEEKRNPYNFFSIFFCPCPCIKKNNEKNNEKKDNNEYNII